MNIAMCNVGKNGRARLRKSTVASHTDFIQMTYMTLITTDL